MHFPNHVGLSEGSPPTGVITLRTHRTNSSREHALAATDRITRSASSMSAESSWPLRSRNVSSAAWPTRLFPSRKGWLLMSEEGQGSGFLLQPRIEIDAVERHVRLRDG